MAFVSKIVSAAMPMQKTDWLQVAMANYAISIYIVDTNVHTLPLQFMRNRHLLAKKEIKIKQVFKEDFDKVMAVRSPDSIYCGADYLQDYFPMLLRMPSVEMYAVVMNEEFVGFQFVSIVDSGKTIVTRGGRVSAQYEGSGIAGILLRMFDKGSPVYKPHITHHAITGDMPGTLLLKQIEKGTFQEILTQVIRFYKASHVQLKTILNQTNTNSLISATRIINEKELGNIFTSSDLCKHFFKEDRLVVDRVPYRPELSNASLIVTDRTTCVVSGYNNSRQPFLLTFGSYSKTAIGLVYNLEMYGNFSETDESLKDHILLHGHNLFSKTTFEDIFIRFSCDVDVNFNSVANTMQGLGFNIAELYGSGSICAERKIIH